MSIAPTVHLAHAAAVDLPAANAKPTSLTGQHEALLPIWSGTETKTALGIWECEPGTFTATRDGYDETCVIVSGRATVTGEDGIAVEVGPGDVLVTPRGWRGTWVVHETCRKVYNLIY